MIHKRMPRPAVLLPFIVHDEKGMSRDVTMAAADGSQTRIYTDSGDTDLHGFGKHGWGGTEVDF